MASTRKKRTKKRSTCWICFYSRLLNYFFHLFSAEMLMMNELQLHLHEYRLEEEKRKTAKSHDKRRTRKLTFTNTLSTWRNSRKLTKRLKNEKINSILSILRLKFEKIVVIILSIHRHEEISDQFTRIFND